MQSRVVKPRIKVARKAGADQKTRVVSARTLKRMKRKSQDRDRALVASGETKAEDLHAISPEDARAATVTWPTGSLEE